MDAAGPTWGRTHAAVIGSLPSAHNGTEYAQADPDSCEAEKTFWDAVKDSADPDICRNYSCLSWEHLPDPMDMLGMPTRWLVTSPRRNDCHGTLHHVTAPTRLIC
jgi:hypothetical protein